MTDSVSGPHGTLLGRATEYSGSYDPGLLQPIPRRLSRQALGISTAKLPFQGVDIWTAFELSWLDSRGKPQVAIAEFTLAADSLAIIESKSLKLYLSSLNQTRFAHRDEVKSTIGADLSAAAGARVGVCLRGVNAAAGDVGTAFDGVCIDGEDIEVDAYTPDAGLLRIEMPQQVVSESLYSDLLKSNCPVTGQPDWGSLLIRYRGPRINRAALLRYIISFRQHRDFHEHCVERMFLDIQRQCQTENLTVYARYTRRGGLDINPFRTDTDDLPAPLRLSRQ